MAIRLLLDENLSDRIIGQVLDLYPGSTHVKAHDLIHVEDSLIWDFARRHAFVIVSKDADFHQRSLIFGAPPQFIFLRVGNCPATRVTELLRTSYPVIVAFANDLVASVLILP